MQRHIRLIEEIVNTETVRVGVIGTTSYAQTHMDAISRFPNARLTAIAGRDVDRATAVARQYGIDGVFGGYEALIHSGTVDAVVVMAPDELHEPIVMSALDRGLHVLCEKPLAPDAPAAWRMTEAARLSGLVNMSYFFLRTTPHHRLVKSLLQQGAIGQVRSASFGLVHGFFRSPEYNWRFDAARGGGVTADLGCYLFDLARWYVGDVVAVAADGAHFVERAMPDGAPFDSAADSVVGMLRFGNGAHATFEASVVATIGPGFQRNDVQLQGEDGRIELVHTFSGATVRLIDADGSAVTEVAVPEVFGSPTGDAEFIQAIVDDRPAEPAFEDGWRVQQVVAAASDAARSGTWADVAGAARS